MRTIKQQDVNELESLFKNYKRMHLPKVPRLPKFTPTLRFKDLKFYKALRDFNTIILKFEDVVRDEELRETVLEHGDVHNFLDFDGNIVYSPVMPDELLNESTFKLYKEFIKETKPDAIISWDSSTYSDDPPEISWSETVRALKLTYKLSELSIPIIGLVKGASEEQVEYSSKIMARWGLKTQAFHATDYIIHNKYELLNRLLRTTLKYAESVLVLGAGSPRALYKLRTRVSDCNLIYSGYSWLISARTLKAFGPSKPVDLRYKDAKCTCKACKGETIEKKAENISHHNLETINSIANNPLSPGIEIREYDAIIENSKSLFASDLHIGLTHSDEPWISLLNFMKSERPENVFFLGDIFDFKHGKPQLSQIEKFMRTLESLKARIFVIRGECDKIYPTNKLLKLMHGNVEYSRTLSSPIPISKNTLTALKLARFYSIIRSTMEVLSGEERILYLTHGHCPMPREQVRKKATLITGHFHRIKFRPEKGIITLGCWCPLELYRRLNEPEPDVGQIIIHEKDGKLNLIDVLANRPYKA